MPTPTRAKPPVSAWIIRERKRLGLKPRDLAERLTAAGLPVIEGTVRTWEAGRNPHPDNVEGLERIFGTRSPDYKAGAGGDTSSVPAAYLERLDALVGTVTDLVAELRSSRQERDAIEARLRALEAAATLQGGSGGGAPQGQGAPHQTAG